MRLPEVSPLEGASLSGQSSRGDSTVPSARRSQTAEPPGCGGGHVTSVAEVVQRALLPPLPRRVGPLELEAAALAAAPHAPVAAGHYEGARTQSATGAARAGWPRGGPRWTPPRRLRRCGCCRWATAALRGGPCRSGPAARCFFTQTV